MSSDNKRKLYDALSQDYDMGSFDKFCEDIKDDTKRKKLYDATSNEYDYGDYESFSNQLIGTVQTKPKAKSESLEKDINVPFSPLAETAYKENTSHVFEDKSLKNKVDGTENIHVPLRTYGIEHGIQGRPAYDITTQPQKYISEAKQFADEEKRINNEFIPKPVVEASDIYSNYSNRFSLTERGKQLSDELAEVSQKIQNKYADEFLASDEYKALQKQYKGKELDKAANEAFSRAYSDKISKELEPYTKAYQKEAFSRYENEIARELGQYQEQERQQTKQKIASDVSSLTTSVDNQLEENHRKLVAKSGSGNNAMNALMGSRQYNTATAGERKSMGELEAARSLLEESQNIIDEAARKGKTNFVAGVGRGFADTAFNPETWSFGLTDMRDAKVLTDALDKFDRGETLTQSEQTLMDAAVANMATNAYYYSDLGRGYKAGMVTGQSVPFMLEFAINPVSASGSGIAKSILKYGMKKFGKSAVQNNAAKFAARLVGDAAAAAAMTGTSSAARVAAGTIERAGGNIQLDETGTGYEGRTGQMSTAEALGKSFTSTFLENQSEMVFNAFKGIGPKIWKIAERHIPGGTAAIMDNAIMGKAGEIYRKIKSNPTLQEVAKRTQFHGLGEEYLEEVYNNFANIPLGEMTLEEATDLDNNIDTFLGLAPTSVAFGLLGLGGLTKERIQHRNKMKAALGNMTRVERERLAKLEELAEKGGNEDIKTFIRETILDNELTPEEKKAEIEYAYNLAVGNAIDDIEATQRQEVAENHNTATQEGEAIYSEHNPETMRQTVLGREVAEQKLLDAGLSVEDIESMKNMPVEERQDILNNMDDVVANTATDFFTAYDRETAMNEALDTAHEEEVVKAREMLNDIVLPNQTVTVVPLGMYGNEQAQYGIVVSGIDANGNPTQSNGAVVTYPVQMVNGTPDFSTIDKANPIVAIPKSYTDAMVFSADEAFNGMLTAYQQDAAILDGTPIEPGAQFPIMADDGTMQDITVANITPTGESIVVMPDGHTVQIPMDELSSRKRNAELAPIMEESANEEEIHQQAVREAVTEGYSDEVKNLQPQAGERLVVDGRNAVIKEVAPDGLVIDFMSESGDIIGTDIVPLESYYDYKQSLLDTPQNEPIQNKPTENEGTTENVQDIQPEPVQSGQLETTYPTDENGEPAFLQMQPQQTVQLLTDTFAEDAPNFVRDRLTAAQKAAEKATKKSPKAFGFNERAKEISQIKQERENTAREVEYWQNVSSFMGTEVEPQPEQKPEVKPQPKAKTEPSITEQAEEEVRKNQERLASMSEEEIAAAQAKVQENIDKGVYAKKPAIRKRIRYVEQDNALGEASTPMEFILREIATGRITFQWGDKGTTQGLGSHLGLSDSVADRQKLIWALSNEGYAPEVAAEMIHADMPAFMKGLVTDQDIFNMILDAFQYGSPSRMFEAAKQLNGNDIESQRGYEEDLERQATEWEAEQNNMSVEDWTALVDIIEEELEYQFRTLTDEDINTIFEDIYNEEYGTRRNETESAESTQPARDSERSNEVLPENEVDNETADGRSEVGTSETTQTDEQGGSVLPEQTNRYTVEKRHHQKSNKDIFAVNFTERMERDMFLQAKQIAKEQGGYYSSFGKGGFIFDTEEQARAFGERVDTALLGSQIGRAVEKAQDKSSLSNIEYIRKEKGIDFVKSNFNIEDITGVNTFVNENNNVTVINISFKSGSVVVVVAGEKENELDFVAQLYDKEGNKVGKELFDVGVNAQDIINYVEFGPDGSIYQKGSALQQIVDKFGVKKTSQQSSIEAARAQVEANPTEAQKEAGNYRKGHITIDGYNITLENPKGSERSGTDKDGNKWSVTMNNDYGYIRGTRGVDGDHIDIFLSDSPESGNVYVVDQINQETGEFDESKVMYGFNSMEEAREAYLSNYEKGWKVGTITEVSKEEFKEWIDSSWNKIKPFSEYKNVEAISQEPSEVEEQQPNEVNGYRKGDKVYYKNEPATIFDFEPDGRPVLDTGMAPVVYEVGEWEDIAPDREPQQKQPTKIAVAKAPETKAEEKPVYGSQNKVVSTERYEELRKKMRAKLNQLSAGYDPELVALGAEMAAYHVETGARKFVDFAKRMLVDMGEDIRPYLPTFYNSVRDFPGIESYEAEMTPYNEVKATDINSITITEDEQTEANTEAIVSEAEAIAGKAQTATAAETEQRLNDIEQALEKVNNQLALIGYYEADTTTPFHEVFGYAKSAEKKALADAKAFAKKLQKDLGVKNEKFSYKNRKIASANIAPAGGDITVNIPLQQDKVLAIYIPIDIERGTDNIYISGGIMYRIESGDNFAGGTNMYINEKSDYPTMIKAFRRLAKQYIPEQKADTPVTTPIREKEVKSTDTLSVGDLFTNENDVSLQGETIEQTENEQKRRSKTENLEVGTKTQQEDAPEEEVRFRIDDDADGRFTEGYKFSPDKTYHVRYASNMASDMERGWSSWNYGNIVKEGTQDEVIDWLRGAAENGESIDLGLGETWVDENTNISESGSSIYINNGIENIELREFRPNEWAVVDNTNAHGKLSSHELPDGKLSSVKEALDYIKKNKGEYDGIGDGEYFDAEDSRVVYESEPDKDGMRMYIVEEYADIPDKVVSPSNDIRFRIDDTDEIRFRDVTDLDELEWLNSQPTVKAYRAMQVIDGQLYPPMMAAVKGKLVQPRELGTWEVADERPDIIKFTKVNKSGEEIGYVDLDKGTKDATGKKATITKDVAYNPYWHTSRSPLNDQFKSAWIRPNLVTVEVEVPESELTSGYRAQYSKNPVGEAEWKSGSVSSKLAKLGKPRKVILSRWDKPVRIVPESEVAQRIKELIGDADISIPENVVTPKLKMELEKIGVKISEPEKGVNKTAQVEEALKAGLTVDNNLYNTRFRTDELSDSRFETIEAIHKEAAKLNVPVTVYTSIDQIPQGAARRALEKGLRVKGWYQNGHINVYLPNAAGMEDIKATLLHEGVAHYGLRKMVGEQNFNSFLDAIYAQASQEVRKEIVKLLPKYNYNMRVATEEYLATMSEKGIDNPTLWEKIKQLFRKMLEKVGYNWEITDNDLRYLLWESRNNLAKSNNPLDVAKETMMRSKLGIGIFGTQPSEDTRFRFEDRSPLVQAYDAEIASKSFRFQEAFQDSMLSLKVLQDLIEKQSGKPMRTFENAYTAENRLSSINKVDNERYLADFLEPLVKHIDHLAKMSDRESVENYIYAKSGLERNEVFLQREAEKNLKEKTAELDDRLTSNVITQKQYDKELAALEAERDAFLAEGKDYSGLTGLVLKSHEDELNMIGDEDARNKREEEIKKEYKQHAEKVVSDFENTIPQTEVDKLWSLIKAANNENLRKQFDSGMISAERQEDLKNMMQYYVPLRGWEESIAEDFYDYTRKEAPVQKEKSAKGRKSLADNPIANIALSAQNAIILGNRNKMKQRFFNFVINRPNELVTIRDQWYAKTMHTVHDQVEAVYPDIDETDDAATIQKKLEDFENEMQAQQELGLAFRRYTPLGVKVKVKPMQKPEHTISVMINGQEYVMYVNGNPRAAQAINGKTNPEGEENIFWEYYNKAKRYYGGGLTSNNPDFVAANFVRDTIHSATMQFMNNGFTSSARFVMNTPKSFKAVFRGVMGKYKPGNKTDQYFHEFVQYGGETGYTAIHTIEDYKKEYDKALNEVKGIKVAQRAVTKSLESVITALEVANRIAEDVNRFNAYMTSREAGKTIEESIDDAKNITVNFNKKGSLGKGKGAWAALAWFLNKWILFFNPAVQGLYQVGQSAKNNKKRVLRTLATIAASGFVMPYINSLLISAFGGDGDDDYFNQTDYTRMNNWLIYTGNGYVKIPLPPFFREIYGMGDIFYRLMTNRITPDRAAVSTLRQLQSAIGFINLIPEGEPNIQDAVSSFMPDLIAPLMDVAFNRDFTGRDIAKDTEWTKNLPEYERIYKGVSPVYVEFSRILNQLGGDDARRSPYFGTFINPAYMEHLVTAYTGGIGKTISNLTSAVVDIATGEVDNIEFRTVPVVNRFGSPVTDRSAAAAVNRVFYDYLDSYESMKVAEKRYKQFVKEGRTEYRKELEQMKKNGEIELIRYFDIKMKVLRRKQNALKENPDNKELEKQIIDLKSEMSIKAKKILQ